MRKRRQFCPSQAAKETLLKTNHATMDHATRPKAAKRTPPNSALQVNGPISASVEPNAINRDRCTETENVNVPREFRRSTRHVDVPKHQNVSRAMENVPNLMTGRNGLHAIVNPTRPLQPEIGNVPRRIAAATVP